MTVPFKVNLKGKTAVITGGGGILCGCMARSLGECGASVAITDLRLEAAEAVAKEIVKAGGRAMGIACNVLEKKSLEEANRLIEKEFGTVDILINGAGGNPSQGHDFDGVSGSRDDRQGR